MSSATSSAALHLQDRLHPVEAVHLPKGQGRSSSRRSFIFSKAKAVHFLIMFSQIMILPRLVTSMMELFMLDLVMFMIYLFCNLIIQLPNYSTCSSEDHMQRGVNSCLVKNYIISTKTYHPANCTGAIVVIA